MSRHFLTQRDAWRVRRAAKRFLHRQSSAEAEKTLENPELFGRFCDECLRVKHSEVGGPIADAVAALIRDFVENPQKWIAILLMLLA